MPRRTLSFVYTKISLSSIRRSPYKCSMIKLDNKTFEFFKSGISLLTELAVDEGLTEVNSENILEYLEGYIRQCSENSRSYTLATLTELKTKKLVAYILMPERKEEVKLKQVIDLFDDQFYVKTDTPYLGDTKSYSIGLGRIENKLVGLFGLFECVIPMGDNNGDEINEYMVDYEEVWRNDVE